MQKDKKNMSRIRQVSPQAVRRVRRSGDGYFLARLAMADEGGQVLPWVVVMMLTVLGVAALVVDCGRAMVIQRELQASTDAAALAAAQVLGTSSSYSTYANSYGSGSGNRNAYPGLTVTGQTNTLLCLNTVKGWGIPCTTAGGLASAANAVSVKQTASVPTLFGGILGKSNVDLSATSTATKSRPKPYNIALIVDSTLSMNETDSNCNNVTQQECALQGVRALLQGLDTNYDHVALFTFPNVVVGSNATAGVAINTSGAATTYTCTTTVPSSYNSVSYYHDGTFYTPILYPLDSTGSDTYGNFSPKKQKHYQPPYPGVAWAMPYTFPPVPTSASGYAIPTGADAASYQITPFMTDYNDGSGNLKTTSVLVQAVGGKSGCGSIVPSSYDGNFGTYYAGAIYAAQAALLKEQASHTNSSNVMIILGDGNSTAPATYGATYAMPDTDTHAVTTYGTSSALTTTGYTYPAAYLNASSNGSYPSWIGECGQAVDAAQYAATYSSSGTDNNTLIFSVAYGAPITSSSGNCGSDRSGGNHRNITPCQTMQQMATQDGTTISGNFYSDWAAQGASSGCQADSANSGTTAISDIYQAIVAKLTSARLIPNGTT
jgi:hypothetical protein